MIAGETGKTRALLVGHWLLIAACFLSTAVMDLYFGSKGADVQPYNAGVVVFTIPFLATNVVGTALVLRQPGHRAGQLLLVLGLALGLTAPVDSYAYYGAVERRGSLPGADFIAQVSDMMFIPWLAIIALILLYTPTGRREGRWRWAGHVAVASAGIAMAVGVFGPYRGDFKGYGIANPLELTDRLVPLRVASVVVLHLALLACLGFVLLRFRRSAGSARAQLRWLALASLPFVVLVVGAYVAAVTQHNEILVVLGGGFLSCFPIAIWIAVERDHLYDVDRLLSRSLTYLLLTATVISAYATTVVVTGQAIGSRIGGAELPAVIGTLVAVSVALPLRNLLQQALDQRFNRREFDAIQAVRRYAHEPAHATTIEGVLREALDDPALTLLFWVDEREQWAREDGSAGYPADGSHAVGRHGAPLAAISFSPGRVEPRLVASVVAEALPEIEAARLRAAITLQLVEVRESRSRIVAAQLEERHRLERNLHDGAQQRLLALAMQLRAVEVSGDGERAVASLEPAIEQLRTAVRELRELANGLRPELLRDGGLPAAIDDLVRRTPARVTHRVEGERPEPEVEETAWFIVCEAVANAVKHARPGSIAIRAVTDGGALHLAIADDGNGGADTNGRGLRGIIDRAEAAGGWLRVESGPGGTTVAAELPCGS